MIEFNYDEFIKDWDTFINNGIINKHEISKFMYKHNLRIILNDEFNLPFYFELIENLYDYCIVSGKENIESNIHEINKIIGIETSVREKL